MNSMKRLRIAGLLSAALLVFVMSGAAQTKDDVVNAYNAGAKAYIANDFAGAVASFQQVIDLGAKVGADADSLRLKCEKVIPNVQLQLALSVYQNKASTSAEVIDAFQKAKDLADKYHDAVTTAKVNGFMPKYYNQLAKTAFTAKDYPNALVNYDKVIALDPNNTAAYFNKALTYKNQNAFDPMVQTLTKTIEIATKTSDTTTVKKSKQMLENEYMSLANIAYQKADYKGALVPLEEVFKYDDKNANAYYMLADCKNQLKEYDAALEAVTKGLQYENPANKELVARFYLQQGVAYNKKGEKEKAVASFKLASVGKYAVPAAAYIKGLTAKPTAAPVKK